MRSARRLRDENKKLRSRKTVCRVAPISAPQWRTAESVGASARTFVSPSAKGEHSPSRRRGKGDRPPEPLRGSQATRMRSAQRLRDENKNCGVGNWSRHLQIRRGISTAWALCPIQN